MAISYSISYTFSPSTTISSSQVNQNFSDNSNTWNGLEAKTKTFSNLGVDTELKSAGTIKSADGTAGAPSFTFTADTATGFYRVSSTTIGVGTSNTLAMGSSKITGLANGTASSDAAAFGQLFTGFQAPVIASTTTNTSTTSNTYQAVTNLSASITPTSSSHRILIMVSVNITYSTDPTVSMFITVKRGATDLAIDTNRGFCQILNLTASTQICVPITFIDSPATTSSTTYQIYIKNSDNSHAVQVNGNPATSSIVLMEVV